MLPVSIFVYSAFSVAKFPPVNGSDEPIIVGGGEGVPIGCVSIIRDFDIFSFFRVKAARRK